MKQQLFTVLFLLVTLIGFSQKHELGEVTLDELNEKKYSIDSTASAVVLFEKGKTFFEYRQGEGFSVVTQVETKIKIYKKEGYDFAGKVVSFYVGGADDETVSFDRAVTYNLVNGKVEKSRLKSEGEFVEKKNKFWSQRKITMPNVREGSIIEFRYTIKSPYISSFPEWNFQKAIPVRYSEYVTSIPEYFTYNVYRKGFLQPAESKDKIDKTITHTEKTKSGVGGVAFNHKTEKINYFDNLTTYKLENVSALNDELYVNNSNNYIASIQHELAAKKMPDFSYESFATTWEDVVKNIYESDGFGNQLNNENYFENDLSLILKDVTTNEDKVKIIFDFVKFRMNWDGMHSYLCDKGVNKAYKDKTGNVAEINLMLTAMLRKAGVEANPVLISTRSNGINLFPSRHAYNYVIAAVEIENGLILLDATNKYALPNILPTRDLNWFGRLIRNNGSSSEVDLMPKIISRDNVNLMASIDSNGEIKGKIKETYTDYEAFNFRDLNNSLSEETYLEKLERKYSGIEISDYVLENKTDLSKAITESYSFKYDNAVEIIGDKMYFSPLLLFSQSENPFKQETRKYPIDFVFPNQYKNLLIVNLPEGYTVESIPSPVNVVFSDSLLSYKFNIVSNGKQLQISSVLDVNTSILSPDSYEELQAFFSEMIKKQKEKIVLKKS